MTPDMCRVAPLSMISGEDVRQAYNFAGVQGQEAMNGEEVAARRAWMGEAELRPDGVGALLVWGVISGEERERGLVGLRRIVVLVGNTWCGSIILQCISIRGEHGLTLLSIMLL